MYPFSCVLFAPVLRQIARYLPHHRSENASKTHPKSLHDKFKLFLDSLFFSVIQSMFISSSQKNSYRLLYQVRPGVTSYATLHNGYTDTLEKMLRRLRYDLFYLDHASLWFDFKIMANTFLSVFGGKLI